MFLPHLAQSFLPLTNPLGMGVPDLIALALAALFLAAALVWRPCWEPYAARLAQKPLWSMLLLAALPVALRLLLLRGIRFRAGCVRRVSHLLEADTLRHFRLANPPHALPQFFETFFVLQEPTYSSIYPVGPGLAMTLGWIIFGIAVGWSSAERRRLFARSAIGCCAAGPRRRGRWPEDCWR